MRAASLSIDRQFGQLSLFTAVWLTAGRQAPLLPMPPGANQRGDDDDDGLEAVEYVMPRRKLGSFSAGPFLQLRLR
jgi:hypothetical protein